MTRCFGVGSLQAPARSSPRRDSDHTHTSVARDGSLGSWRECSRVVPRSLPQSASVSSRSHTPARRRAPHDALRCGADGPARRCERGTSRVLGHRAAASHPMAAENRSIACWSVQRNKQKNQYRQSRGSSLLIDANLLGESPAHGGLG